MLLVIFGPKVGSRTFFISETRHSMTTRHMVAYELGQLGPLFLGTFSPYVVFLHLSTDMFEILDAFVHKRYESLLK